MKNFCKNIRLKILNISQKVSALHIGGSFSCVEILSTLYRNQKEWVIEANNSGKFYSAIHNSLKVHGITLDKILGCIDDKSEVNKKTWSKIIATRLEGQKNGVNSTPSFFLNGEKIEEPFSYELLQKLVK